ncbi:MAG: hypothetical protein JWL97_4548 [Gemmatimonadales bacterium]|nr:hypothetical protein [Gemmatimonadales bacterium]
MTETEQTPHPGPTTTVMPVVDDQPGVPPERWYPALPPLPGDRPPHGPRHARHEADDPRDEALDEPVGERWRDHPWLLAAVALLAFADIWMSIAALSTPGAQGAPAAHLVVSATPSPDAPTLPAPVVSAPATHHPRQAVAPPRPKVHQPNPYLPPAVRPTPTATKTSPKPSPKPTPTGTSAGPTPTLIPFPPPLIGGGPQKP